MVYAIVDVRRAVVSVLREIRLASQCAALVLIRVWELHVPRRNWPV